MNKTKNIFIRRSRRAAIIAKIKVTLLFVAIAGVLLWATTCNLSLTSSCF